MKKKDGIAKPAKANLEEAFKAPERWRTVTIPGASNFDGKYEVSDRGRIRSCARMVQSVRRGQLVSQPRAGKLLRLTPPHAPTIRLNDGDGTILGTRVSRLVALAFVKMPKGLVFENAVARHKDDDPSNNVPTNLTWGTQLDNIQDMVDRDRQPKGSAKPQSKLDEPTVRKIKRLIPRESSNQAIVDALGLDINPSQVSLIRHGKAWSHVSV